MSSAGKPSWYITNPGRWNYDTWQRGTRSNEVLHHGW